MIFTQLRQLFQKTSRSSSTPRKLPEEAVNSWYFYRGLDGQYRQTRSDPEDKMLILVNREKGEVLCPNHAVWEQYYRKDGQMCSACGQPLTGLLAEFRELPEDAYKENILKRSWRNPEREDTLLDLDENGISRDLVIIKITENRTKFRFFMQLVIINHKKAENMPRTEIRHIPRFRSSYSFEIPSGAYMINKKGYELNNRSLEDFKSALPQNVYDFALKHYKQLVRLAFRKNLPLIYSGDKNDEFLAIQEYPYDPNLYDLVKKTGIKVDRSDMNGFTHFCQQYGVKTFKAIRKAYAESTPLAPMVQKGMEEAGFRDKNIIPKVFGTPAEELFHYHIITYFNERYIDHDNICSCCRHLIAEKGEIFCLNILLRSLRKEPDFQMVLDGIYIYNRLFDHLPEELKKDVYENGFTRRTHDELSRFNYDLTHEYHMFKYDKKQLELEDDINGYSFRLPEDNRKLRDIGIAMHNCVGTYDTNILEKKSTVVYATKDGAYRLCIEVNDGTVLQERTDFNDTPEGEDAEVMRLWRDRHQLSLAAPLF